MKTTARRCPELLRGNYKMNTLENFNPCVTQEARANCLKLAELAADWIDTLNGDTFGDDPTIEPVEFKSRDGFISHNNGGFSVTQSFFCGISSGIFHSKKEREFYEKMQDECGLDYQKDTDEAPEGDEFWEYEQEYFNEAYTILELELFFDEYARLQVSLLLHYRDAPYHRSNRAEEIFCQHYSQDNIKPEAIMGQIITSYAEA